MEPCELLDTPVTKVYTMSVASFREKSFYDQVYASVHGERRAKVDGMKFPKGKYLSLGVEYLLRQACLDFGLDYCNLRQVVDKFGKLKFDGCPYQFNLSHSGDRAMCIMSRFPVGCDVERIRRVPGDIGGRFFSPEEQELLNSCREEEVREKLFFKLWTLKESFMKCTGLGFHLPLKDFSIIFDSDKIRIKQSVDEAVYSLDEYFDGEYQYAWCVRE